MPWGRCATFTNVGDVILLVQEGDTEENGGDTDLVIGVDAASAQSKWVQSCTPRHRRWSL